MNYFILSSFLVSFFAVIGHFTMGTKLYLKPVMDSDIDTVPKYVMKSLFHYMSVFMIITTALFFLLAFNIDASLVNLNGLVLFVGVIYGGFAIVQFIISLAIEKGPLKIFQWIFWLIISLLSIFGSI